MGGGRKPRILIFDDEAGVLHVLEKFFSARGYEVFAFDAPKICPVYQGSTETCANLRPCADLLITDHSMPLMTGIELLEKQKRRGCRLEISRKALISGNLPDDALSRALDLGCAVFRKPFALRELLPWVEYCESRADLSRALGVMRRETRFEADEPVVYSCGDGGALRSGTVINISDSGLCLRVQEPLVDCGTIKIGTGLSNCCRAAAVRWVRPAGVDAFMVGLNCS